MSSQRSVIRPIVFVLCVAVTALGLINTYGGNADVIGKAQTAACGAADCAATMIRMERTPLAQTFTFQTALAKGRHDASATVDVECRREFVLLGDYQCTKLGAR